MKNKIIYLAFNIFSMLLTFNYLHAQELKRHRFGLELLGEGLYFNAQYDFRILKKQYFFLHLASGYHNEEAPYLSYHVGLLYDAPLRRNNHFIEIGLARSFFNNRPLAYLGGKSVEDFSFFTSWNFSLGFLENFGNNWYWRVRGFLYSVSKEELGLTHQLESAHIVVYPFLGFTLGKTF